MKRIFLLGTVVMVLMFSSISISAAPNSNQNVNNLSAAKKMQSKKVKAITIQFQNKEMKISNKYRVKSLKKLLNSRYYIRTPKKDAGKGWVYLIKGKTKNGNIISKITIINSRSISLNGKTYKVPKLNLKKIKYCLKNGNKTPILKSKKIKSINVQFKGKYKTIKNNKKIKKLKKIFSHAKIKQINNTTKKGWIYRIKASDKKGKVIEEIIVIDKNHLSCMGDTYKCKINLKKLDRLFNIKRWQMNLLSNV